MQDVTVPLVMLWATGSATWVGVAAAAEFAPALLLIPVGGLLADRLPPRRLLVAAQLVSVVLGLALWSVVRQETIEPGFVIVLVAAGRAVRSLVVPAFQCLLAALVPAHDLPRAVALNSARLNASRPAGFLLATLCLVWFDAEWVFVANAASSLVAFVSLTQVDFRGAVRAERKSVPQWRQLWARKPFRDLMKATVTVSFLGGPLMQLLPVIGQRSFGAGSAGYGVLATSFGVGAVIASLISGDADYGGTNWPRVAAAGMLAYGAALVALAVTPWFQAAVVVLFALGFAYLVVMSALNTSVHLLADDNLRGRAIAMYMSAFSLGYPAGAVVHGWLTDRVGARLTLSLAGLLLCIHAYRKAIDATPHLPGPCKGNVVTAGPLCPSKDVA